MKKTKPNGCTLLVYPYVHGCDHELTLGVTIPKCQIHMAIQEELERSSPSQIYEDLENMIISRSPDWSPEQVREQIASWAKNLL